MAHGTWITKVTRWDADTQKIVTVRTAKHKTSKGLEAFVSRYMNGSGRFECMTTWTPAVRTYVIGPDA